MAVMFSPPRSHLLSIMNDMPNDNPDWDAVYFCVTVDMPPRGNFVLGAGITPEEAKQKAMRNVVLLGDGRLRTNPYEEHARNIAELEPYYGMMVRSTRQSTRYNKYFLRPCEAKIYIYGEDERIGYNGMSYYLCDTYANFALFAHKYDTYYDGIRHDIYAIEL